jgi:hypothetical protein
LNPGREVEIETSNKKITLINFTPTIEDYELSTTNAPINLGLPDMDLELEMATTNAGFDITNLPFQTWKRSKDEKIENIFSGYYVEQTRVAGPGSTRRYRWNAAGSEKNPGR